MRILNAISPNMINEDVEYAIHFRPVALESISDVGYESCVGHAGTASLFTSLLGFEVKPNRVSVTLLENEEALLGQYIGPRLEEGATSLPEGAVLKWFIVHYAKA